MKDNIIQRLEALRQAMRTRGIDLTIIPMSTRTKANTWPITGIFANISADSTARPNTRSVA